MSTNIAQQHVPFVPRSVSVPLVTAAPLAAKLASTAPELLKVSKSDFEEVRINDFKQLAASEIDSQALRGILDLYVLNMQALFTAITNSLQLRGQYEQLVAENDVQTKDTLNRIEERRLLLVNAETEVRQITSDLELSTELYAKDTHIDPTALFEACLFRLNFWQQKWQEHCLNAVAIDLKSQRDTVLSATADCLVALCEAGVTDVISFDPAPQSQEDVYLSLYEAIEHPFAGVWPKIVEMPTAKKDAMAQGAGV
jgi:hypothetical protein